MTIEERMEKVERQNRKLRKLSLASIALALAALIGGTALSVRAYTAAIEPTSVTTQNLYIKDSSGRVRFYLAGNSFRQYDASGNLRIYLFTEASGYHGMTLRKSNGSSAWGQSTN
jgi:hypothetical protein